MQRSFQQSRQPTDSKTDGSRTCQFVVGCVGEKLQRTLYAPFSSNSTKYYLNVNQFNLSQMLNKVVLQCIILRDIRLDIRYNPSMNFPLLFSIYCTIDFVNSRSDFVISPICLVIFTFYQPKTVLDSRSLNIYQKLISRIKI